MIAAERREASLYARARGISGRRSDALAGLSDSSRRYVARERPRARLEAEKKVIELSSKHPRYGYRRLRAILRNGGENWNHKFIYRICKMHKLTVPKKKSQRRIQGGQNRKMSAICPNAIWAFDFVHDSCANGQKLKCFAVKDEFTRECLAIEIHGKYRSENVLFCLKRLIALRGRPAILRCDNGPEFIALTVGQWARVNDIFVAFTDPGKPWQNGSIESFNSRFRDECLNMEMFSCRREARVLIEQWRNHYNQHRPHSALNYQAPETFRSQYYSDRQKKALLVDASAA